MSLLQPGLQGGSMSSGGPDITPQQPTATPSKGSHFIGPMMKPAEESPVKGFIGPMRHEEASTTKTPIFVGPITKPQVSPTAVPPPPSRPTVKRVVNLDAYKARYAKPAAVPTGL